MSQKTHTSAESEVKCRICGKVPESVGHILSGCSEQAQSKYLSMHDTALKVLFYELFYDEGPVDKMPPWYTPKQPKPVVGDESYWNCIGCHVMFLIYNHEDHEMRGSFPLLREKDLSTAQKPLA